MVAGANRQRQRKSSQSPQSLNDTTGSHADKKTSTLTGPPDPVNQIALAIENLALKTTNIHSFIQKIH